MPDILFMFILSVIEQITFLGSMYFFLGTPLKKCLYSPFAIVVNIISTFIMFYIQTCFDSPYMFLNVLPAMLQYFIAVKLVSHSPIKKCISAILCTYLFQFTFQILPAVLMLLLFPNFTVIDTTLPSAVIIILAGIATLILYRFRFFRKVYSLLVENYLLIFSVFLVIFLFIITLSRSVSDLNVPENIGQLLTLFLSLIIFFIFFFVFFVYKSKNKCCIITRPIFRY